MQLRPRPGIKDKVGMHLPNQILSHKRARARPTSIVDMWIGSNEENVIIVSTNKYVGISGKGVTEKSAIENFLKIINHIPQPEQDSNYGGTDSGDEIGDIMDSPSYNGHLSHVLTDRDSSWSWYLRGNLESILPSHHYVRMNVMFLLLSFVTVSFLIINGLISIRPLSPFFIIGSILFLITLLIPITEYLG